MIEGLVQFAEGGGALLLVLALFVALVLAEGRWSRRPDKGSLLFRWLNNLSLTAVNFLLVPLMLPASAWAAATLSAHLGFGLLQLISVPATGAILIYIVLADLTHYAWHRLAHSWSPLWRLHLVHHTDLEMDVSTSYRGHPLAKVVNMVPRTALIVLLGPAAGAAVLYELLRVFPDITTHANVRLPPRVERGLRLLVVTPDMHRVHHSIRRQETDSNFGSFLSCWDYLFGTFRWRPVEEHASMSLGLEDFRDRRAQRLDGLLLQPWRYRRPGAQIEDRVLADPEY